MPCDFTSMWSLKNKTQKQAHKYREQTDGFQKGGLGMSKMDKGEREIQASSYGTNRSWE